MRNVPKQSTQCSHSNTTNCDGIQHNLPEVAGVLCLGLSPVLMCHLVGDKVPASCFH